MADETARLVVRTVMKARLSDAAVRLPLRIVDTEGDFGVYSGETLGLGVDGLSARLPGPLPCAWETSVHVELPDGREVFAAAVVAAEENDSCVWTYRLVFVHLDQADVEAVRALLSGGA